ncbi:S-layer homology domain-containing protein [Lysinibacillus piscis]|uniref:SLH domain-containing protein n=1 Tax=Lysinibacillus piscis TaxID=2518931 RepID=A0ABQ5NHN4_9BACI|nr:S-layer homology domain-containing protein [Lysinibacillus sp. KH24]GLC87867.1 hypothetical protein LYSBPC_09940 [Lysinibacillus sp. KH24]
MMKKRALFQGALIAALTTSAIVAVPAQAAEGFTDVDYTKDYGAAVKDLTARGIIKGYTDGTFKPFANVTRGQVAKILAGLLQLDTKNVENPQFTDVQPSDEYYGAIAALANAGIVGAFADGRFGADMMITRGQLASMLTAAYELDSYSDEARLPFTDIEKYSDAYYAVLPLFEHEITKGLTPTLFGLNEKVTRAQLTLFISRIEAMQAKRVFSTFTAATLKAKYVEAYSANNLTEDGQEIFRIYQDSNQVKIEALQEGAGYFMLIGYNFDKDENYEVVESQKYKVTVIKVDGQLKIDCQPTDELTPGAVTFWEEELGINPKTIKLTTLDGHAVSEKVYTYAPMNFDGWDEETIPKGGSYELNLLQAGDYIATVSDDQGKTVRVGIKAESDGYDLYTSAAIEKDSVFISTKEIGFTVKEFKMEQYSGAMYDHKIIEVTQSADGLTIKKIGKGDSMFAIRLDGAKGEKLYVQGMMFEVSGVTSLYYELMTQEQMENPIY